MFGWAKRSSPLDIAIKELLADMGTKDPTSEEYSKLLVRLIRLEEVKAAQRRKPVSADTLVIVGGNLLVALMILNFERGSVMVTKAKEYFVKP